MGPHLYTASAKYTNRHSQVHHVYLCMCGERFTPLTSAPCPSPQAPPLHAETVTELKPKTSAIEKILKS